MDAGCIKYESSGILWRSSVERPEVDVEWLEQHGDTIQILQLQGFMFFGNAQMVLDRVDAMLKIDDAVRDAARRQHEEEKKAAAAEAAAEKPSSTGARGGADSSPNGASGNFPKL